MKKVLMKMKNRRSKKLLCGMFMKNSRYGKKDGDLVYLVMVVNAVNAQDVADIILEIITMSVVHAMEQELVLGAADVVR